MSATEGSPRAAEACGFLVVDTRKRRNPCNYHVLLARGVFKNVGYELSSEKLVLPYICAIRGGPGSAMPANSADMSASEP